MGDIVFFLFFLSFLSFAAYTDLRDRTIGNGLCLAFLVAGCGAAVFRHPVPEGFPVEATMSSLSGVVVVGTACLAAWRFGALGGGDVKVMAAAGAWTGPFVGLGMLVLAVVFAGLHAGVVMLSGAPRKKVDKNTFFALCSGKMGKEAGVIPCGPSILAAGCAVCAAKFLWG